MKLKDKQTKTVKKNCVKMCQKGIQNIGLKWENGIDGITKLGNWKSFPSLPFERITSVSKGAAGSSSKFHRWSFLSFVIKFDLRREENHQFFT